MDVKTIKDFEKISSYKNIIFIKYYIYPVKYFFYPSK